MIITVASGKGGTGKTTVAVNLALSIGRASILDCDVEEPNVHTLLEPGNLSSQIVELLVPVVDQEKCTLCGKCGEFCEFNAIFVGKTRVIVYNEICHSCGGCAIACPEGAIKEVPHEVGIVHETQASGLRLVYGELNIGEPIATSIIKAVKDHIEPGGVTILDAPPGTACPVIETAHESDFLLLVTEPTPFGVHDLVMAVDLIEGMGIPMGVIVNRAGIGDDEVRDICEERGIPILMEIPFDRKIAELYSRGIPFTTEMPEWRERFIALYEDIKEMIAYDH